MTRSWATVHPHGSGRVYPNFPDPDLDEWDPSYYGHNYERLQQIKALYDPSDFFRADPARGQRWTSSPVAVLPQDAWWVRSSSGPWSHSLPIPWPRFEPVAGWCSW